MSSPSGRPVLIVVLALLLAVFEPAFSAPAAADALAPLPFNKLTPANSQVIYDLDAWLTWEPSKGAAKYELCLDQVDDGACNTFWTDLGLATGHSSHGAGTFYWQVRAVSATGTTYANNGTWWRYRTSAPAAFVKEYPADNGTVYWNNVGLDWDFATGATEYEYCVDGVDNNICDTLWVSRGVNTNATFVTFLVPDTFFWQVRATNEVGTTYANGGTWWSFRSSRPAAFTKETPPDTATVYWNNVLLDWEPATGATEYEYCVDGVDNNICDNIWVSRGANTDATFVTLSPDSFYWQVRASNQLGTTYANNKAWWHFRSAPPAAFGKVSPASPSTIYESDVLLDWEPAAGAAKYEYCFDTSSNGACDTAWVDRGTATNAPLIHLPAGLYYWEVRASNPLGITRADAGLWWKFLVSEPQNFAKLSPADHATLWDRTPSLSWQAATGATRYEYCVDTSNNDVCNASWVAAGTHTSAQLAMLPPNTYYWQVSAVNTVGRTLADAGSWHAFRIDPVPPDVDQLYLPIIQR